MYLEGRGGTMELTPRVKQILQIMLQDDQKMTVQTLADRVGVSRRTVQREMEYVERSLKGTGVHLVTKMGSGVWLEGSAEKKKNLLFKITDDMDYDAGNREERRKRLILEILRDKELKKLYYYSSIFKVSEATISGDLEAVGAWLSEYGIQIVRRPGNGIGIQGSESDYRRAISAFIEENIDAKVLMDSYEKDALSDYQEQLQRKKLNHIIDDEILEQVAECIMGVEGNLAMRLTENSLTGLIIHITIALKRILKGEIIEEKSGWENEFLKDEDYFLAKHLMESLKEKFSVEIPEIEIFYIYLHLKGAKHEKVQSDERGFCEEDKLLHIVRDMIDVFDPEDAWIYRQDDELIQGLLAHLRPVVVRIMHQMKISNPILDSVKAEYPEVFERCISAAAVLEKYLGKSVPEEEIGFLAVHFGAAQVRLESRREKLRQVNMGVVCASGIGVSRLMTSKLRKTFHDRVKIIVYGKRDINPYIMARTDFFVSSIPLETVEIPVVFVNPLLNEEDMEKIHKLVHKYERMPEKYQEKDNFSKQLEKINLITSQINAVIKYMDFFRADENISFEELLLITGERFSPYHDREEMIRSDLRKRERITSQVLAEFGFALLHARTRGVVRPGLAICLPKDGECFRNPYFKKIRVIFIMLIPDDENVDINGEILGYLSSILLDDNDFMKTVLEGNEAKIRNAVSVQLREFFQKYLAEMG